MGQRRLSVQRRVLEAPDRTYFHGIALDGGHQPAKIRRAVQFLNKVESPTPGDLSSLTVYSTDYSEGVHYQMKLHFSPANGGEIRFQNQGLVWKRRGDTAN